MSQDPWTQLARPATPVRVRRHRLALLAVGCVAVVTLVCALDADAAGAGPLTSRVPGVNAPLAVSNYIGVVRDQNESRNAYGATQRNAPTITIGDPK